MTLPNASIPQVITAMNRCLYFFGGVPYRVYLVSVENLSKVVKENNHSPSNLYLTNGNLDLWY
jgi:hypothetical protein